MDRSQNKEAKVSRAFEETEMMVQSGHSKDGRNFDLTSPYLKEL